MNFPYITYLITSVNVSAHFSAHFSASLTSIIITLITNTACVMGIKTPVEEHLTQSPQEQENTIEPLTSLENDVEGYSGGVPELSADQLADPITDSITNNEHLHSAYFYALKGKMLQLAARYREASEEYNNAYNLAPNAFLGAQMIAMRMITGTDQVQALKDIHKLVLLYPRSAELKVLRGKMLLGHHDHEAAQQSFQKALHLSATAGEAYLHLINILMAKKDYKKAQAIAQQFSENLPSSLASWLYLLRTNIVQKHFQKAYKDSQRALIYHPRNLHIMVIHAYVLAKLHHHQEALHYYTKVHQHMDPEMKNISEVLAIYEKLLGIEDAYTTLDRLTQTHSLPHLLAIEKQKIWIRLHQKRPKEAIELAEAIQQRHREDSKDVEIEYLKGLAWGFVQTPEGLNKAMNILSRLPSHSRLAASGLILASQFAADLKKTDQGLLYIEKLLQNPTLPPEHLLHAILWYQSAKLYHPALAITYRAQQDFPNSAQFMILASYLYYDLKEEDKVQTSLKKLISLFPRHHEALNFLGYFYAERGINLSDAESLIQKAITIAGNQAAYLDSLGWVYYQQEKWDQAEVYLLKANSLTPQDGVIEGHLAALYLQKKHCSKARHFISLATTRHVSSADNTRITDLQKRITNQCSQTEESDTKTTALYLPLPNK